MNPFAEIKRVAFELSNRCVLAERHAKCPAHLKLQDPTVNLPARVVHGVLASMKTRVPRYSGFIYFHLYNEPLADPRLFEFVRAAARALPSAVIQITTNGWNYDQTIHDELAEAGVRAVRFSIYSKADYERLRGIRANRIRVTFSVTPTSMKNADFWNAKNEDAWRHVLRADIPSVYSNVRLTEAKGVCRAPYRELCVTSSSDVVLCCMDWKRTVAFGNLLKEDLAMILESKEMVGAYARLKSGDRFYSVCRRCRHRD